MSIRIPRFIYHITTTNKYKNILKDGVLKPAEDLYYGEGIFALDLTNFFKRWGRAQAWNGDNLMVRLLKRIAGCGNNLCMLRIPTKSLDTDLLVIRSQNRLFSPLSKVNMSSSEKRQFDSYIMERLSKGDDRSYASLLALEKFQPDLADHLEFGSPAKYSKLFKQRKEAIEYIYPEEIPTKDIKNIGEVNLLELKQSNEYNIQKPLRSIFTQILKGTPEAKGAELLNC